MTRGKCANPQAGAQGFTLLELSIVLVLIGIIIGMGLVMLNASLQASQYNAAVNRMDDIEKALLNFAIANNRIPCPADLTLTSASSNYGFEAGAGTGSSPGTATGACTGVSMVPVANFKAASGTVEGGVPTRALQLPDDYMYDGWGRKFRFAVDPTMTKTAALPAAVYSLCSPSSPSAIAVDDATGAARTTAGIYALISHGANGHGAHTSNGVTLNAGSVNPDELTDCHCTSAGAYTGTYTPTYVEKVPMQDANNALDNFDDIVTFKEGWQMQAQNYPVSQTAAQCVYVSDGGNNRVQVFTTDGAFVRGIGAGYNGVSGSIGSSGTGNGQFNLMGAGAGVATDSSGNIWAVDANNNRVEEFNSSGTYLSQFPCPSGACTASSTNGSFNAPAGIAIDSSNNIWVADYNNCRVEKFTSSGAFLMGIGAGYNGVPGSIGSCGSSPGQFPFGTESVSLDASGNIWVVSDDTGSPAPVEEFNSAGIYVKTIGVGNLNNQAGAAVDASGNIWVTEWSPYNDVKVFNSSGTQLSVYATGDGPTGIAIDSSGNVWVVDWNGNAMQKLSSSGSFLSQFPCPSGTCAVSSTNGSFITPDGIAIGSR